MAATTTAQDILDAAWQVLNDPGGVNFYPAADMFKWINEGVEQVRQVRPDCLLETAGTLRTITPVAATVDVISVDDRWYTAILEWVLFRGFDADADDRRDQQQSQTHRQNFELALQR